MVLTLGGDEPLSWRHIKGTDHNYTPLTKGICINGFVYYGAWSGGNRPPIYWSKVIVCFGVRSEKLSVIKLPSTDVYDLGSTSTIINYRGNLAIFHFEYDKRFFYRDLWVLQDANESQWWEIRCSSLDSLWELIGDAIPISFHNTNNNGEIVIAPKFLPRVGQPFYIIYCNAEKKQIRRVEIEGVADDEDFRRRYEIGNNSNCQVFISTEHVQNYTFL